jgi:hypothetical protein
MCSPSYRLAAAITIAATGEFLVVRQPSLPLEEDEEYQCYVNSNLYDFPDGFRLLRAVSSGYPN